jgi:Zn-dependent M28 family amino/carboxypeptidase
MAKENSSLVSGERLHQTFNEICSLGPRWQGSEGEAKILAYLEDILTRRIEIGCAKEQFEYLGFRPLLSDLTVEGPSLLRVNGQALAYSGSKAVTGELIYIPEAGLDKTAADGKIVLTDALKSYQAYPRAVENGAAGFIIGNNLEQNLVRAGATNYAGQIGSIPGIAIGSKDTQSLRDLAMQGVRVRIEVAAHSKKEVGWNLIVSMKENSVKPEILICSHYDSMWLGPHAFDNASGTAAILELIRVFKGSPYHLTFLLCGAEELGFWGSKAFVNQHVEECKKLRAVVCLDGICSDLGSVEVGATENLAPILREFARKRNFRVDQWSIPPRPNSDHLFFEKMGVPVFWLTSMDPFYHTEADLPEHVSKEKLARHTDFAAHVIMSLEDKAMS